MRHIEEPRIFCRLAALLLALIIPMLAAAPIPRETKQQRIEYYPSHVGSKWIYKHSQNEEWERTDIIESVLIKNDSKIVSIGTVAKNGDVEHRETFKLTERGLFKIDFSDKSSETLVCYLKFPVQAGDKWDCPVRGTIGVATCEGLEGVDVPAGRFNAAKVVVRYHTQNLGGGEVRGWFAPGIGAVKWQFGDGDAAEVLHSFTPGQK